MRRFLSVLALGSMVLGPAAVRAGLETRDERSGGSVTDVILDKTRTGNSSGDSNFDDGWDQDERYGGEPSIVIRPDGRYPDVGVEIWTDRGENGTYCIGDDVRIGFRVDSDAFLTIYDLDTDGRVRVLFPNDWHNNNFVRGGRTYYLPRRGYRFEVVGPSGREYLRAVASTHPDYEYRHGGRPRLWDRDWDSRSRRISPESFDEYFVNNLGRPWDRKDKRRDTSRRRSERDYGWINMDETLVYIEDSRRCGDGRYDRSRDDERPREDSPVPWRRNKPN